MKLYLCIALLICVSLKLATGVRPSKPNKVKEITRHILEVDSKEVIYGSDGTYWEEGVNKKITCKGSQRNQKIDWYDPEGNLVKRDPTNHVYVSEAASSKVLVFSSAKERDSGVWQCRSGDQVQNVTLCIMASTDFGETLEEVSLEEGRSLTLSCQTKGNPDPTIQWYRNGELLVDDGDKYFTSIKYNRHNLEGLLTIKDLNPFDMGVYVCEAVQQISYVEACNNTATFNITLNVNHAPTTYHEVERYIFAEDDENVTLVCGPTAYPKPEFRWFSGKMATEIPNKQFKVYDAGYTSSLQLIANSSVFDKTFICKAKNEFGVIDIIFMIRRLEKPGKLTATTDFIPRQRTLILNITFENGDAVFAVDGVEIQYFEKTIIGEPKEWQWNSAKTVTFEENVKEEPSLKKLKINSEYWVRLRGYNKLGEGPWSKNILASTAYEDSPQTGGFDVGIFLGIIVTAVIVLFGAGCISIVKKI